MHIHPFRRFFGGESNVEDSIFVSTDRIESYAMAQSLQSKKQLKISLFYFKRNKLLN